MCNGLFNKHNYYHNFYTIFLYCSLIQYTWAQLALSLLHHILSPPPPSALHPFFLSLPRKEQASLGDPNKTQDQQQPSLCGTNPRRKRVPKAGRVSESPTHSLSGVPPQRLSQQHIRYAEDQSQTHAGSLWASRSTVWLMPHLCYPGVFSPSASHSSCSSLGFPDLWV